MSNSATVSSGIPQKTGYSVSGSDQAFADEIGEQSLDLGPQARWIDFELASQMVDEGIDSDAFLEELPDSGTGVVELEDLVGAEMDQHHAIVEALEHDIAVGKKSPGHHREASISSVAPAWALLFFPEYRAHAPCNSFLLFRGSGLAVSRMSLHPVSAGS